MLGATEIHSRNPYVGMSRLERHLVLGFMTFLAIGIGTINLSQGRSDLLLVYAAFLCYLLVLALPFHLQKSSWGWFHPLILTVLWFELVRGVLPRLIIYATGLDFHRVALGATAGDLSWLVIESLFLTSLGLLALYAGFLGSGRLSVPRFAFRAPRLLFVKVLAIAAVSTVAFAILIAEAGGLGRLMLQRGMASDLRIQAELGGHWYFMVELLKTACLLWLALQPKMWKSPAFLSLFSLALFMGFAATGSRSGVVMPVVLATVIWSLHHRRIPYGRALVIGVLGIAAIGLLGEFRVASRGAVTLADARIESGLAGGIEQGLDTITSYAGETDGLYGILAKVPEDVDLLYGWSYLSIPAAPIPRALWPGKPDAGGRLNATYIFGNPLTAIPPENVGEAYWNFHIPGVIVVMFLFGAVLKWFARFYVVNGGAGWVVAIYVFTMFNLQPSSPAFYDWFQTMVPVIFFLWFFCGWPKRVRMRTRKRVALPLRSELRGDSA